MIIHEPETTIQDGEITLSSLVEWQAKLPHLPERLWFSFPESYQPFLTTERGEPAFLALLIPAMHYQETVEVRAPISPKVAYVLGHFQSLYKLISFGSLNPVEVNFKNITPFEPSGNPTARCMAFSGGVDSTLTLLSHLPESPYFDGIELSHGLFISGFYDMTLDRSEAYQKLFNEFTALFTRYNIEMLQARTNVHDFSRYHVSWGYHYNSALHGVALAMSNLISVLVKPIGNAYDLYPNSEVAASDQLIQTETFSIFTHGGHINRFDKTRIASEWPPAREYLRVCFMPLADPNRPNCGKCRKCLLAIVSLAISGTADNLLSRLPRLTFCKLLRWTLFHKGEPRNDKFMKMRARENKKRALWLFLVLVLPLRDIKRKMRALVFSLLPANKYPAIKRYLDRISIKYQI